MASPHEESTRRRDMCRGCKKPFTRLSTHISQNAECNLVYAESQDPLQQQKQREQQQRGRTYDTRIASVASITPAAADAALHFSKFYEQHSSKNVNVNEEKQRGATGAAAFTQQNHPQKKASPVCIVPGQVAGRCNASSGERAFPPWDAGSVDGDGNVFCDDDDDAPVGMDDDDDDDDDDDVDGESNNARPSEADTSVLMLYDLLTKLRSNPLELSRFSQEEKVYISLMQLLMEIKAPLNAFTRILRWAAKANNDGHQFSSDNIPTREKMIKNLFDRYNMNGLRPKEASLYLPYSKRIV